MIRQLFQAPSLAVIVVLGLSGSAVLAQTAPSTQQDEVAGVAEKNSISGRVVNEKGEPLPDARVFIRPFGSTIQFGETLTDSAGAFKVSGLKSAVYFATASLAGYTAAPRDPDSTQATSYRVGDSITLVLLKGGVITGSVTSSTGEAVVNVSVRVQMIRDANGRPSRYGAAMQARNTDDRGVYRVYGLATGTYLVSAGGGGGGSESYENDAPTYSPSSARDTAAEVTVRAGEETSNIDIRYRGDKGHKISGVASGPLSPDSGGYFLILSSTLDAGSQWNTQTYQPTGGEGFVFYGVPDGDYDVTSQAYFPSGEHVLSEPKRVRVRGADISGIEVITKPLGSISGQVVLENSNAIECKGKRRSLMTEILVSAWHNEKEAAKDQPQFVWSLGGPSSPKEQGDISLRNLAAGQYQIIARQFAKYWYLRAITLPAAITSVSKQSRVQDVVSNWTTVKSGDRLTGMVITVAEGAGSLRGRVTLKDGETLPGRYYIYLVPVEREKSQDVLQFLAAPISSDKEIVVNNIPPGRYWIVTQPALDGPSPTLTRLRLPDESETRNKLRRIAEATKTEIEFKPCQNVVDYQLPLRLSDSPTTKNTTQP